MFYLHGQVPFFGWFFGDLPKYNRNTIDFIKEVGRLPIDRENLDKKIDKVLKYMKEFKNSLTIQRVCCHTLSNVCMDVQLAKDMVVRKHVHTYVMDTLNNFGDEDWRLCWLGCSALWNMSRSDEARYSFDISSTVRLLISITETHTNKQCVINTAIGSLSNLSLNSTFKKKIGTVENVLSLLTTIENNVDEVNIAATGIGLLANLAVNDNLADLLVDVGLMGIIRQMLLNEYDDVVFLRNSAAAISNCMTSPIFIQEFIRNQIIESLSVTHADDALNLGITSLIDNALEILQIDSCKMTTSYHLACLHGLTEVFDKLIMETEQNDDELDINAKDLYGRSLISYAMEHNHIGLIAFLTRCGATIDENYRKSENSEEIDCIISESNMIIHKVRKEYNELLVDITPLHLHEVTTVMQFLSPYIITRTYDIGILNSVQRSIHQHDNNFYW